MPTPALTAAISEHAGALSTLWLVGVSVGAGLVIAGRRTYRTMGAVLLAGSLAALLAFVLLFHNYYLGNRGDAWIHMALALETADHGLFPGDPYFVNLPTPPQYSLLHVISAGLMRLSGATVASVWTAACLASYLARLLCVYLVAAFALRSRRLALVAVVFCSFALMGETANPWSCGRPFVLAITFMLLSEWLLLKALHESGPRMGLCVASAGLLGLSLAFHLFVGIMALGALALIVLLFLLLRHPPRPAPFLVTTVLMGGIALVVGAPWIVYEAVLYVRHGAGGHAEWYESIARPLFGSQALRIAQAGPVAESLGGWPLAVAAAAGSVLCGVRAWRKRDLRAAWLAMGAASAALLLLTPLFGVVEKGFGCAMAPRVSSLLRPEMLAILPLAGLALAVRIACRRWKNRNLRLACLAAGAAIAAVVFLLGRPFALQMAHLARYYPVAQAEHSFFAGHPEIRSLVRGQVVLSDPWTSYRSRIYFGCKAISVPRGEGSPYAEYPPREELIARVLSGRWEEPRSVELRRRFPFAFVLVNRRAAEQVDISESELKSAEATREQALRRAGALVPVYDAPEFGLYKVRDNRAAAVRRQTPGVNR